MQQYSQEQIQHLQGNPAVAAGKRRPHVVILGGGFAGLEAAKQLGRAPVEVTLIDRSNHHLFQPLLYQVATASLAPSDISAPIRYILRKQKNTAVLLADVKEIDPDRKVVTFDDTRDEMPYDYLIVATGARHSYFGHDEWAEYAPGLKSLGDALEIRHRFLLAFEEAEKREIERAARLERAEREGIDPQDAAAADRDLQRIEQEREAHLTFVIVGGGPTGCELAGVLGQIAKKALRQDFRYIDTTQVKVYLIEAGPRILPPFPEDLAARAQKDLEEFGVTILTGDPVTNVGPTTVTLKSGRQIESHTILWAAGNAASPLAKSLTTSLNRAGQVQVKPDLSVPERPEIFVAGDLAFVLQEDGKPVPGVAQGAIQGGKIAGKNVLHLVRGEPTEKFNYWNKGNLAVIGRNRAIADLGKFRLGGFIAWAIWLFIHILYLVGFRNRLSVLLQWAYAYLTYERGVRLINAVEPVQASTVEQEQRERGQAVQTPVGAGVSPWPK